MKHHKRPIDLIAYLVALAIVVLPAFLFCGSSSASAVTIWNGASMTFTKADAADPTLTVNQDQLTANVSLTRGFGQGLYNAKTETNYTFNFSPADTEWLYGELADYASLTYTDWEAWFGGPSGGGPTSTLNRDAVLHLKTDDIYLSIKFLAWSNGHLEPGGGFSYIRSTPGVVQAPPPAPTLRSPVVLGNSSFRFS